MLQCWAVGLLKLMGKPVPISKTVSSLYSSTTPAPQSPLTDHGKSVPPFPHALFPDSPIKINTTTVSPSPHARGVILDSLLSIQPQIKSLTKSDRLNHSSSKRSVGIQKTNIYTHLPAAASVWCCSCPLPAISYRSELSHDRLTLSSCFTQSWERWLVTTLCSSSSH